MDNGPTVAVSEFESTEDSSASPELDEAYLALALTRLHEMHIKVCISAPASFVLSSSKLI